MSGQTDIYWLEQRDEDVPAGDTWLGPDERSQLCRFRFPKRRRDWLLGRWTAKCAVSRSLGLPQDLAALARVQVVAQASGAPVVLIGDSKPDLTVSLSHSSGIAACALVLHSAHQLGCDLELIEPRGAAFLEDYFNREERAFVGRCRASQRPLAVTLLWSAKESALKALQAGLRLDTREVTVDVAAVDLSRAGAGWSPLSVIHRAGSVFGGWWRSDELLVATVVSLAHAGPPVTLHVMAGQQCSISAGREDSG